MMKSILLLMTALIFVSGCQKSDYQICSEKIARGLMESGEISDRVQAERAGAQYCAMQMGGRD